MARQPGVYHELVLIDQTKFHQRKRGLHASHEQSFTRLPLELLNGLPQIPERRAYISLRRASSDAPGAYRSRNLRNLALDPGPLWLMSDSTADTRAPTDKDIESVHCREA